MQALYQFNIFNQRTKIMKKKIFLFLISSSFLFPLTAFAGTLENLITLIPYFIIAVVLAFFIFITGIGVSFANHILEWITSPSFVSLSYTVPCKISGNAINTSDPANCNPIISIGLQITQSFVNVFIVIALIVIALSFALKIKEYASQKIFATLIIVGLLVNFAPLFVGLLVDATNIVMQFFLDGISEGATGVLDQLADLGKGTAASIWGIGSSLPEKGGVLMQGIVQIIVNVSITVALLLFAVLFLVRYVIIWILTIFSPLAFSSYILPATKKHIFDKWFDQLIQWSIIGIPIAFFLYLGLNSFTWLKKVFIAPLTMPGIESAVSGGLNDIFPFFVIIIFLVLGFGMGLQTGAMGSKAVIGFSKEYGIKGAALTGRLARRGGRQLLSRVTIGREEAIRKFAERQAAVRIGETFGTGKVGKAVSALGWAVGATPVAWALRRGLGETFLRLKEAEEKEVAASEKKYEGANVERKASTITNRFIPATEKIGALRKIIDDGQIGEFKGFLQKTGLNDKQIDNQIISIGREALRIHPDVFKPIRDAFPHLAEKMGKGFSESIQKAAKVHLQTALEEPKDAPENEKYSGIAEKIIAEMKPSNVPKMDSSVLFGGSNKNKVICEAAKKRWQAGHWKEAGQAFGKKFCDGVREEFLANPQSFTPSAQRYFTASPSGSSLYGI